MAITGKPVKELEGITPASINENILSSPIPLVLRGYAEDWPAVKVSGQSSAAALSYIEERYARVPVTTCLLPAKERGRIFYNEAMNGFNFSANLESFHTFTKMLLNEVDSPNPRGVYMPSTDADKWFPGVVGENNAGLDGLDPIKLIWIGNKTQVAAHYDFTSNLACCLCGRRKFTLFPPEQITNLYPGPLEFAPGGQEISLVDFQQPDFRRFPRFKNAMEFAQTVILSPGDALFLPSMWWHHVEGLDAVNVLYTHWWRESPAYYGRPSNALLHAILGLSGLSSSQRKAWRSIFDYYVFNDEESESPASALGFFKGAINEEQAKQLKQLLTDRLKK